MTLPILNDGDIFPASVYNEIRRTIVPVENVLYYGADPTGEDDSTNAFIDAHDALPDTGGAIGIPAGSFKFNQTVQANQFNITKSNVALMGVGWASKLIKTNTGTVVGNQGIVNVRPIDAAISKIVLKDFAIEGPTPATGAAISGVNRVLRTFISSELKNVSDVLMDGVLVEKTESAGIAMSSGGSNFTDRLKIRNCVARNLRQDGINDFAGRAREVSVIGCEITDCDGFGMEMAANYGGHLYANNVIRRTGQSAIGMEYNDSITPTGKVVISNNQISDITTPAYPDASGISLGQSATPKNTEIRGNSIYRCGGFGVVVNLPFTTNIDICDNTIVDIGGGGVNTSGIFGGTFATHTRIMNNRIAKLSAGYNLTYGVAAAAISDPSFIVAGNHVYGYSAFSARTGGQLYNWPEITTPDETGNIAALVDGAT